MFPFDFQCLSSSGKQWVLCSQRSHGTKSALLESKLSTGTSRTKRLHQDKFAFSLFWMSQCVACSPAWRILYHVTASCKGKNPMSTNYYICIVTQSLKGKLNTFIARIRSFIEICYFKSCNGSDQYLSL